MTREPILTSSALLFLFLGVLSVAPLVVGFLQSIAAWRSPPSERLGPLGEFTAWGREVLVLWGVGSLWPLQMLRRTWRRHMGGRHLVPVVLVPGYLESETLMMPLQNALKKQGRSFATYKYQPLLGPGEAQARRLATFLKDTQDWAGSEQVDVIGHSYGGLLLRRVIQNPEPHGIRRLVVLGTPHRGSRIAGFALGAAGRDLWLQ